MVSIAKNAFLKYAAKLLILYLVLDYGTTIFIGITAPGGYYVEWLDKYFNYVSWLRNLILSCSKYLMHLLGYDTYLASPILIRIKHGAGVQLVYSCLGYGVLSFWIAFVVVNQAKLSFKLKWLFGGLAVIIFSNILRVCILLIALQKRLYKPFSIDHHTFYNIVAYLIVIAMMFIFLKQLKKQQATLSSP
ncbi:MAG: exosortase/archaeosortase family protein [Chitinophagaceae bacterium]|nr:exosortase/archaeosortase family protein [Chitinophagaceae bacterium]MCW5904733.1 exosortase/archaeosortase family protein [Chitinophagaceae bacterium]